MSRGGRGGGAGAMVALAGALGIQRHEMGRSRTQLTNDPAPEFPVWPSVQPICRMCVQDLVNEPDSLNTLLGGEHFSADELYRSQRQIQARFRDSPFYIEDAVSAKKSSDGIRRYSDKYKKISKPTLGSVVNWSHFPSELRPKGERTKHDTQPASKRQRVTSTDDALPFDVTYSVDAIEPVEDGDAAVNIDSPSKAPDAAGDTTDPPVAKAADDDDSDADDEEPPDDDDMNDDNDYVDNYFDNGEDYGDESGDNLDEDAIY